MEVAKISVGESRNAGSGIPACRNRFGGKEPLADFSGRMNHALFRGETVHADADLPEKVLRRPLMP